MELARSPRRQAACVAGPRAACPAGGGRHAAALRAGICPADRKSRDPFAPDFSYATSSDAGLLPGGGPRCAGSGGGRPQPGRAAAQVPPMGSPARRGRGRKPSPLPLALTNPACRPPCRAAHRAALKQLRSRRATALRREGGLGAPLGGGADARGAGGCSTGVSAASPRSWGPMRIVSSGDAPLSHPAAAAAASASPSTLLAARLAPQGRRRRRQRQQRGAGAGGQDRQRGRPVCHYRDHPVRRPPRRAARHGRLDRQPRWAALAAM